MSSHYRLSKKQIFTDQAVSSTTAYTSPVIHILNLDNVFAQMNIAGTPVGSFVIQVSADHSEDIEGNVLVAGNWVTVITQAVSGANVFGFDLNQLGAPWIRIVYTNTSSTGTINGFISGKGLM